MSTTVAIHHPRDPRRPTVIPEERYDPAVHRLWGSEADRPAPDLPDDLPGRAALMEAGVTTLDALRRVGDFDEIPGIGQATEARLHEYLERDR